MVSLCHIVGIFYNADIDILDKYVRLLIVEIVNKRKTLKCKYMTIGYSIL